MPHAVRVSDKCALVLGGGGPLGIAWEAAMLDGWAEGWAGHGTDAPALAPFLDGRMIGTSAGAIVSAHLAVHGSVAALVAEQSRNEKVEALKKSQLLRFVAAFLRAKLLTRGTLALRQSLGRSARRAALPGEAEWVQAIARSYAPQGPWPQERELLLTVVDAETGEFHVWDHTTGVPLATAVAASCSVPCAFPLVHVNGRAYMDGGIGSSTNALLARGCARAVILDPLGRMMGDAAPREAERRELEAAGTHTLAFLPDEAVGRAIGRNVLDMSRRSQVSALGRLQGLATASGVWNFVTSPHAEPAGAR